MIYEFTHVMLKLFVEIEFELENNFDNITSTIIVISNVTRILNNHNNSLRFPLFNYRIE